jgi:hypothetical protein
MLAANLQYYAEKSSAIDTIRDIFFLCNWTNTNYIFYKFATFESYTFIIIY